MDRRNFLYSVTAAASGATASATVTWQVKGFYCITCAVGLETMLKGLKGITRVNASYPSGTVVIAFDKQTIGEEKIKEFIRSCGFSVD